MLDFLGTLGAVVRLALTLDPALLPTVTASPFADMLPATVALLGGASLLAGQGVVLFANRLSPRRFLLALLLNGLLTTFGWVAWALSIWAVATLAYGTHEPLVTAARLVCLAAAPLLFGVLVLLPYLGIGVGWCLRLWSLLILVGVVRHSFSLDLWAAWSCAVGGWLLLELLEHTLGLPILALRERVWRTLTGVREHSVEALVEEAYAALDR